MFFELAEPDGKDAGLGGISYGESWIASGFASSSGRADRNSWMVSAPMAHRLFETSSNGLRDGPIQPFNWWWSEDKVFDHVYLAAQFGIQWRFNAFTQRSPIIRPSILNLFSRHFGHFSYELPERILINLRGCPCNSNIGDSPPTRLF